MSQSLLVEIELDKNVVNSLVSQQQQGGLPPHLDTLSSLVLAVKVMITEEEDGYSDIVLTPSTDIWLTKYLRESSFDKFETRLVRLAVVDTLKLAGEKDKSYCVKAMRGLNADLDSINKIINGDENNNNNNNNNGDSIEESSRRLWKNIIQTELGSVELYSSDLPELNLFSSQETRQTLERACSKIIQAKTELHPVEDNSVSSSNYNWDFLQIKSPQQRQCIQQLSEELGFEQDDIEYCCSLVNSFEILKYLSLKHSFALKVALELSRPQQLCTKPMVAVNKTDAGSRTYTFLDSSRAVCPVTFVARFNSPVPFCLDFLKSFYLQLNETEGIKQSNINLNKY